MFDKKVPLVKSPKYEIFPCIRGFTILSYSSEYKNKIHFIDIIQIYVSELAQYYIQLDTKLKVILFAISSNWSSISCNYFKV